MRGEWKRLAREAIKREGIKPPGGWRRIANVMRVKCGRKNITLTEERHDDIYEVYEQVVASYGEAARHMTKSAFYEETAARVKYSAETVRKVVAKRLNKR